MEQNTSNTDNVPQTPQEYKQVENPINEWNVYSSTSKTTQYTVLTDGEMWSCTCPGYFYRGYCKHITSVKTEYNPTML